MKRKLIKYEVFEKMKENSLSKSVKELVEAEEHLARALNLNCLTLNSFNESTVIYESCDGTYVRATYSLDGDKLSFENIEELVIDEESEKQEARGVIANMLEAILDDNDTNAYSMFEKYMGLASMRQKREAAAYEETTSFTESEGRGYWTRGKNKQGRVSIRHGSKDPKKVAAGKKGSSPAGRKAAARHSDAGSSKAKRRRENNQHKFGSKLHGATGGKQYKFTRKMEEWNNLATNVINYADYTHNSHILTETVVNEKDGNTSVLVPTEKARNEGKILKMQFDILKTDFKVLREAARRLTHDQTFCQGVADIKRYNNLSDNNELEESIGMIVKNFPSVLYLTQEELAHAVHNALDNVGVTNYDDITCTFIAEGILRVAHNAYSERVERIYKLANKELKEVEDGYLDFQGVAKDFFPSLDESTVLEMRMFEDLYNASVDVRRFAMEAENEVVRNEASSFIEELEEVLNGRQMPSIELAAEVANWLESLVEANVPMASDSWSVVKTPHKTIVGDHPQMNKNAKVPAIPGSYPGDWGDTQPQIGQDSNAWNHGDETRNHSWSNKGGKDAWPALQNPYTPKPFGDYTMKGEKGVDKEYESGEGMWQSGDTWPALQNPYIPKEIVRHQKVQPDNPVE